MRLVEWSSGVERCRYTPAMAGAHTALFMARVARASPSAEWSVQAIGDVDHTARDWGTLCALARRAPPAPPRPRPRPPPRAQQQRQLQVPPSAAILPKRRADPQSAGPDPVHCPSAGPAALMS